MTTISDAFVAGATGQLSSLPAVLRARAVNQPDDTAHVFLENGERPRDTATYRELHEAAGRRAAHLVSAGLDGGTAVLMYPAGLEFVRTLLGCMYARVTGAPVPVPNRERSLERVRRIADDADTLVVLTTSEVRDDLTQRFGNSPLLAGLTLVATDTLPARGPMVEPGVAGAPAPEPSDIALLQYTSGSTGSPKGVMVSHANFLGNVHETDALWPCRPDDVFISWLPHFHDMGMLFGIVMPLWSGRPAYLMAPEAFIRRPSRWLEAISRFRGTHSAAPSFAYELCVREAERGEVSGELELSAWRVAANGAEPVRWGVIQDFVRAFAPRGFRPEAMCPGYGLAENTLKASGSPETTEPAALWVSAEALYENRVELRPAPERPGAGSEGVLPLVGCGISVMDTRLCIVDPATRLPAPPGTVGEIWINGPCVAAGYRGRPDESRETFRARVAGDSTGRTFLRTGDLGFLHHGELYVTGRLKDVIIRKGRNFYPQDIELSVERSDAGLRPNCSAAFSVDDGMAELLVVVVEADGRVLRKPGPEVLAQRVRAAVYESQRLTVDDVVVVRRGSLPKTSSGKVQRRACRDRYAKGALSVAAPAGRDG
ncbi:hypothetical protein DVA86_18250 [Streptomyces armeniacus]|uniref:Uncharacterized protein n=1 Tax=Streptomyces armeniacus TaxID=83291 RepID=A0A345XRN8_9ACTN|nr:fatty acyl-AMP ligase [Streptomyces armeniacus]AWS21283.1 acyl-CoA synthetase [Streptomyces armeniacus]AXK34304.1 hypothetical protein DVA86_18250 [Streptomyces armeniacus]AZY91992.1 putative fatty acyl-AMP ligase [Streptomyces armeniacus]